LRPVETVAIVVTTFGSLIKSFVSFRGHGLVILAFD